ncbi:MAG: hypothetical protein LUD68_06510, partial [Rikenellaceae bacterium]|nr:hypothetical protein [Rikenellaceae bacterium]
VIICFLFRHRKCDLILLNSARNGIFYLFPALNYLNRVIGQKKFALRLFGGNFDLLWNNISKKRCRLFLRAADHTDLFFVETNHIKSFLEEIIENKKPVIYFPNVRKPTSLKTERNFNGKFVFISQIKNTKGVDEILQVSDQLPPGYSIDLYGPMLEPKYTPDYFARYQAHYRGVLEPQLILETLNEYDILLLPTYHPGEGYPGILIESLSLGIPVITTT